MSKFIASSVNYSETDLLKTKYLSKILELYNKEIISEYKTLVDNAQKYIIPNNNNKYYLLIVNKNDITPSNINNKYKILYFFPENDMKTTILTKNLKSDFYVEIDNYKTTLNNENYLFEGYLYNSNEQKHFLISDILAIDSNIIKCDYSLRYALIYKLLGHQHLDNLNGHLNIGIHSIFELNLDSYDFDIQTAQLFNIFKNNFVFKNEICSIEHINEISLKKYKEIVTFETINEIKIIIKGKYIDVYNVYNKETNNNEGMLYVKGLKESKMLQKLIEKSNTIELECSFNHHFKKWQPIL